MPTESSGLSRVVITTDVPSRVERFSHVEATRVGPVFGREVLCAETPCTVSLPYGDHELYFDALGDRDRHGTAFVKIRRATTVVNHTLGQSRTHPVRPLGAAVVTAGLIVLFTSAVIAGAAQKRGTAVPQEAKPMALIGLGSIVFGGIVVGITPTTVQDGATTQWTPTPAIAGATLSAGGTF